MSPMRSVDLGRAAPPVVAATAGNPGPMTADGTNSFLIGAESLAIIDPGPDLPEHRAALIAQIAGRPVLAVLVTHSHRDHSAGAAALAGALKAPVLAFGDHAAGRSATMAALADQGVGGGEGADAAFAPDRRLADAETLTAPEGGWRLQALHTPGHMSNHLCFALETPGEGGWESRALFSGDHVMAWSTSLVSPPDGDMGAYMRSLARLAGRRDPLFLPAHGAAIGDPAARLAELIAHRRGREAAVLTALAAGPADAAALTRAIYTDVAPAVLPIAERNLLAHLIDLTEQGRIAPEGGAISTTARFALI